MSYTSILLLILPVVLSSCSTPSDNPPPIVIGQAQPVEIKKPQKERAFDVHGQLSFSTYASSRL